MNKWVRRQSSALVDDLILVQYPQVAPGFSTIFLERVNVILWKICEGCA